MSSTYMPWAKEHSRAEFNLATSGVAPTHLRDLPVRLEDLEINCPGSYGYRPLIEALARHCGVAPDRIVTATGTSMANYLALGAALKPGDDLLIERPAYEPMLAAARYLGANIQRFDRTHESGFALDPAAIERAMTPKTKLIAITNLHNPTSALTDEATIQAIGEIARSSHARVLVDEVYLDAAFERAPKSAALIDGGDHFIVTSSLTKVYGLSGLRCGWIVAEPQLAHAMWRLNDLFGVIPAHMADLVSVIALAELPKLRERTRVRLDCNRGILHRFLDSRADLDAPRSPFGTIAFPKLLHGTVDQLCEILRSKYATSVAPGEYFESPDHFRIGIGGDAEPLEEGLRRLSHALDEL